MTKEVKLKELQGSGLIKGRAEGNKEDLNKDTRGKFSFWHPQLQQTVNTA